MKSKKILGFLILSLMSAAVLAENTPTCANVFRSFLKPNNINAFGRAEEAIAVTAASMLEGYHKGLFPWSDIDGVRAYWYSPEKRAVLKFENFKLNRTNRKALNKVDFTVTRNQAFEAVLNTTANIPRSRLSDGSPNGRWIEAQFAQSYLELFKMGKAHSFEVWDNKGELVGGLFGVKVGKYFSGESMFRTKDNASRLAVVHLVEWLKSEGVEWIDIQVMSSLFKSMGAEELQREEYLMLLSQTI